jgi:hypothetical protein
MPRSVPGRGVLLAAIGFAAGCATHRPEPAAAPEAVLPPSRDPVRVSLVWSEPVDLDLYVTDPAQETVYFANNPSGSGGRLESDLTCRGLRERPPGEGAAVEAAAWREPTPGRYRVGVDFGDRCTSEVESVRFRVVAEVDGKREERIGEVGFQVFEPIVLEFEARPGRR